MKAKTRAKISRITHLRARGVIRFDTTQVKEFRCRPEEAGGGIPAASCDLCRERLLGLSSPSLARRHPHRHLLQDLIDPFILDDLLTRAQITGSERSLSP